MFLDNVAPEIRLEILQLCSPKDLASLSMVHSSLRDVAERVLYTHIHFLAHPFNLIGDQKRRSGSQAGALRSDSNPWALDEHKSLLHTLSTSARKAKMVKSLYIELHKFIRHHNGVGKRGIRFILTKLSQLLKDMPNLVDFRIIYDVEGDPSEGLLSKAIRHDHLRLHTLWLAHGHDFKGFIAGLPNLRFLGIYFNRTDKRFRRKIKELVQTTLSPHTTPTICMLRSFTLGRAPAMSCLYSTPMVIFPASHRLGEAVRECQEIVRFLNELPQSYFETHAYNITFDLFGITKEDIDLLCEVMEGLATSIQSYSPSPCIGALEFRIDDITIKPWLFPGFINALPLFEDVEDISFTFPGIKDGPGPSCADIHLCLMKDLGKAWPNVQRVTVRQRSTCMLLQRESDWDPTVDGFWDSDEDDEDMLLG
ncbi:hypothetical protein F5887DRAFT_1286676 [Amanita rubescens]|nr:hypothetical protein F5887DRAFT_1286676 [Amanita rubescens]